MAESTRPGRKQDETAGNDREDTATGAVDLVKWRCHRCIVQKAPQQVCLNGRNLPLNTLLNTYLRGISTNFMCYCSK